MIWLKRVGCSKFPVPAYRNSRAAALRIGSLGAVDLRERINLSAAVTKYGTDKTLREQTRILLYVYILIGRL